MIERKVIRYIEEQQMFTRQSRIIVALSGGADSVRLYCVYCFASAIHARLLIVIFIYVEKNPYVTSLL